MCREKPRGMGRRKNRVLKLVQAPKPCVWPSVSPPGHAFLVVSFQRPNGDRSSSRRVKPGSSHPLCRGCGRPLARPKGKWVSAARIYTLVEILDFWLLWKTVQPSSTWPGPRWQPPAGALGRGHPFDRLTLPGCFSFLYQPTILSSLTNPSRHLGLQISYLF